MRKMYDAPKMLVVTMKYQSPMLAGSPVNTVKGNSGLGLGGGGDGTGKTVSRSRDFDIEEEDY